MIMKYTENELDVLKEHVKCRMSEKRFSHTLAVERTARILGELILPSSTSELRAAAILHDVTKEIDIFDQINMLESFGFPLTEEDKKTEGIIHSFTAPITIKRDFSRFATENILSAIEKHTVGDEEMSIFDMIIFVSDYAEDTRPFPSCKEVRKKLFENLENENYEGRVERLKNAFCGAVLGAENALNRLGVPINSRMEKAKIFLRKNNLLS